MISILDRVRTRGHELSLTIAGGRGPVEYMERINTLVRARGAWTRLSVDVDRVEWNRLISANRYGSDGMTEEHFGMSPAEMVAAGCIVLRPGAGGQREILDGNPGLLYVSEEDAAEKIDVMLKSPTLQESTRAALAANGFALGVQAFSARFRAIVEEIGPRR